MKRLLQPDLGLLFFEDEIVCTTHVAFLNLGLTKKGLSGSSLSLDNLGPHLRDRMVDIGEYVGLLLRKLGEDTCAPGRASEASLDPVRYRDVKSKGFYGSIAARVAPGHERIGILLTQMLSQVNTARVLAPKIAGQREAALKIGFVSLYQTALGLQKLLEEERDSPFLKPEAVEVIGETLASAKVQDVLAGRGLRNNLVHYGVGKRTAPLLSSSLPLYGLVEAHMDGETFDCLASKVEAGLDTVSRGLRDLLPRMPSSCGQL